MEKKNINEFNKKPKGKTGQTNVRCYMKTSIKTLFTLMHEIILRMCLIKIKQINEIQQL